LTELVQRAEGGDEIVLTRHGQDVARLMPVASVQSREARRAIIEKIQASAASKAADGLNAAQSQDFLYGKDGLPE